jgi:RNA polymerase sigma factor (TIGR02999 family)
VRLEFLNIEREVALGVRSNGEVTQMLMELSAGNADSAAKLMPLVYDELRRLAAKYLRQERPGHTLQATALVHEAYLRLVDTTSVSWKNRPHFFGVAAHLMRQILVQYARERGAAKRGGGAQKLSLDETVSFPQQREFNIEDLDAALNIEDLDAALNKLAELDAEQSRIVELRFFGGLTIEETAEALGVSPSTVKREWTSARAWLRRQLS